MNECNEGYLKYFKLMNLKYFKISVNARSFFRVVYSFSLLNTNPFKMNKITDM